MPIKVKNYVLLFFSLLFYAWGEPVYILLMLFASFVDYGNGLLMTKYGEEKEQKKDFLCGFPWELICLCLDFLNTRIS